MKELEFSIGRNIGGGLLLVGLAPEPRFTGEGNPRIAPRQVPQFSVRPWTFAYAGGWVDPQANLSR